MFSDGNVGNKYVFSYFIIHAKFSICVSVKQELKTINTVKPLLSPMVQKKRSPTYGGILFIVVFINFSASLQVHVHAF